MLDETGRLVASYEYDPYGRTIIESGSCGYANPLGFSSEITDRETGTMYYNYRDYNPTDGRWLTRDPIGERGGHNLYGFSRVNPIMFTDQRGLNVSIRNTKDALGFHWKICVTNWEISDSETNKDTCCCNNKKYIKNVKEYCIGFGPKEMSRMKPSSNPSSKITSRFPIGEKANQTPVPPEMQNVNNESANRVIHEENEADNCTGNQPGHLPDIETTCQEDINIKVYLWVKMNKQLIIYNRWEKQLQMVCILCI